MPFRFLRSLHRIPLQKTDKCCRMALQEAAFNRVSGGQNRCLALRTKPFKGVFDDVQ